LFKSLASGVAAVMGVREHDRPSDSINAIGVDFIELAFEPADHEIGGDQLVVQAFVALIVHRPSGIGRLAYLVVLG
jgi:hypothetical protein